jgi:vanillate O-demethylase monooxygenase subunit
MPSWPLNQWYVAAYSTEIEDGLLGRTICDEPLVFYRTSAGEVVGLADRCVHRRYPLSLSHLKDDQIICGYHGFTYDKTGGCVAAPAQKRIPKAARVPSFQVREQDSLVWVWIGDQELADEALIPRAPWLDSADYTVVRGREPINGRYGLLVDNLMDLSHETYLHGGYIGTPEVAETPITTEVDEEANVVYVSRHMDDAECPPFYAKSTGIEGRITRWQDIEYHAPCLYLLHSRIAPVGVLPPEQGPDDQAFHVEITYAITPETEHSTHDFWMVARDFALGDEEVTAYLASNNRTVVMQDVEALNVLEEVVESEKENYQELSINIDTGGLAARRILKKLIAAGEAAPADGAVAEAVR